MSAANMPQRRMRADARRNYERVLAEAEVAFRERGTEASLEEVARRAGVSIGTLYGHFPTRQALLEAMLHESIDRLVATAEELLTHPSPGEALARWAGATAAHMSAYRGLASSLLSSLKDESSPLHRACQQMTAAGERLLDRARSAGLVRAEASAADMFALVNAAAWVREQVPAEQGDRLLAFMIDGLRPVTAETRRPADPGP
ncbi:TetR/AcrR family transcriptional regulator [Dactylosporangium aurantiacum]|uniref:TetR/AcrR family transcriptional regulator n=1 Tax=Dactylosporangium aurantiacum TaxID=35754 RepID=A0A9Q9IM60_9ACTN|nr:TetR/AcrR family transcriptional regulator [Dactylosporangium aurantiacum]MDG6107716.1 helix-turn-helix domain containing protein [Dactylosporangium aurantiacum]UWZ58694.1 TetR/AcrR family transcriptional regulator [Dactylosporangium aurantiacum]